MIRTITVIAALGIFPLAASAQVHDGFGRRFGRR